IATRDRPLEEAQAALEDLRAGRVVGRTVLTVYRAMPTEATMDTFVYDKRRPLPQGFDEFVSVADTAVVSIDLHQGHLADAPDCPCPAPRAREVVEGV